MHFLPRGTYQSYTKPWAKVFEAANALLPIFSTLKPLRRRVTKRANQLFKMLQMFSDLTLGVLLQLAEPLAVMYYT